MSRNIYYILKVSDLRPAEPPPIIRTSHEKIDLLLPIISL